MFDLFFVNYCISPDSEFLAEEEEKKKSRSKDAQFEMVLFQLIAPNDCLFFIFFFYLTTHPRDRGSGRPTTRSSLYHHNAGRSSIS